MRRWLGFGFLVLFLLGGVHSMRVSGDEGKGPARAEEPAFGPEVNGLRARVALPKSKFKAGEPVVVRYTVRNVSREKQVLWHGGFWPNHLILVRDAAGREPALTPRGREVRRAFSPGGPRDKNISWEVAPGGEDDTEGRYDLTELCDLRRPGRYTVQYVYEEKQGGWVGRLPSNVLAFEVVAE